MRRFFLMISLLSLLSISGIDYTKTEEFKQIIRRVESWRSLIDEVKEARDRNVPTDLALAIIAQESLGNNNVVSVDGHNTVCIFQVRASPWMNITPEQLRNPVLCAQWGLFFLEHGLDVCNGNEECALRSYNCGPTRAFEGDCGKWYASRVQEFWRPYFSKPLERLHIIRGFQKRFVRR